MDGRDSLPEAYSKSSERRRRKDDGDGRRRRSRARSTSSEKQNGQSKPAVVNGRHEDLENAKVWGLHPRRGPPKPAVEEEYQRQLSQQIHEKQNILQKERREDVETSQKHFETWKGFWGRPGHGAPKGLSQREKLDRILYYIPAKRISSGQRKTAN